MENVPSYPRTWEELIALKNYINSCPGTYLRHPSDEKFYTTYRQVVPKEYFLEVIKKQIEPDQIKLLKNGFPYTKVLQHLPRVGQFTLWSLQGPLEDEKIEQEVNRIFPEKMWFAVESAPHRKSVPEIWHTHIFVKDIEQYSV